MAGSGHDRPTASGVPHTSGMRTRLLTVLLTALGLVVSACGSGDTPDITPNRLIVEYWGSPAVKNDRLPGYGEAPEDRKANLAAYFSPDQLVTRLLSVFPCTDGALGTPRAANGFDSHCASNSAVRQAVRGAGGDPERMSARVALVKHPDGGLELMTLYVANGKVIDANAETYGSLDEFRAGNDLLTSDDVVLVPRDITQVGGQSELVTVYGHTPWAGWPWLFGGGGVLVLLVLLLAGRRIRRSRRAARESGTFP